MSRVSEKHLNDKVATLAERYPGRELQLQSRGWGFGVFANKPGKWVVEGMRTNGDTSDAISAVWTGIRLENERLLDRLKAIIASEDDTVALNGGTAKPAMHTYLLDTLSQLIESERYHGW